MYSSDINEAGSYTAYAKEKLKDTKWKFNATNMKYVWETPSAKDIFKSVKDGRGVHVHSRKG